MPNFAVVVEFPGPQGATGSSTSLFFNVKDYGAVGDGTTDDRTAFVNAIAAANTAGGGTVYVPSGSYKISAVITPSNQKNIRLVGEGWQASKIKAVGGFLNAGTTSDQWTIEDLQIQCTTSTNTSHGIRVDIPRRWRISRCYFIGFGGDSIRFDGGIHSEVEFCYFSAVDPAVANGHAALYITVSGSDFATTITTRHNYVGESKGYGFLFDRVTAGASYSDVFEFCTTAGLRVDNCTNMQVYQPYFEANPGPSSQYYDSSAVLFGADTEDAPAVTWSGASAAQRIFTRISRDDVTFGASVATTSGAAQSAAFKFKLNEVLKAFIEYNGGSEDLRIDSDGSITFAANNSSALRVLTNSDVTALAGNMIVDTVGKGLRVAEGTNAKMGSAVLIGGTKVVSTTAVTANSRILITSNIDGGTPGFLRVSARTASTSFTITSSSGTDTSTVAWMIVEPS